VSLNSTKLIVRTRIDVVSALVDKALGAARAGTKKRGSELCAMYVEVENTGEGVIVSHDAATLLRSQPEVMVGFDSKQPKVVAGSISCVKDIIE